MTWFRIKDGAVRLRHGVLKNRGGEGEGFSIKAS